jgi:hypothetical protein
MGAVAILTAATLATGCTATHRTAPPGAYHPPVATISTPATPHIPSATAKVNRDARGGAGHRSSAPGAGLPADWPPEIPVPQGTISGSAGSAGRWTVLLVASGSAAEVRRSTLAFYTAAGFTAVSDSVLNSGNRQISLVVENRDHSATETNLVIGVSTTSGP